jgi:carbonic anhydrase
LTAPNALISATLVRDLTSGMTVFFVALPLCVGVALASDAPLFAGLIAGIVGGLLVGILSRSRTSVSGPAVGLTAVVASQIAVLGSYPAFLLAVVLAGLIQIGLGLARGGALAGFIPSPVIKGFLAAVGVVLILKQLPHVFGHDLDPEGEFAFLQRDQHNTFSELFAAIGDVHLGAAVIGVLSVAVLVVWDRVKALKQSPLPAPLLIVVLGVGLNLLFRHLGGDWTIGASHLIQVPADFRNDFGAALPIPDFSQWRNPAVYWSALMIAAAASLETLMNLQAVDRIDPRQRTSPPSRELWAQGVGNVVSGLAGGLPISSVIVHSSVNIDAGGRTKLAAMVHGVLLLAGVTFLAPWLNLIPLSCLAAVLLMTGVKLASPASIRQMWAEGKYQFAPCAIAVVAIVLTDLIVGVLIGLAVSVGFILRSNLRKPVRTIIEKHLGGDVVHFELANQVSFLNRAALARALDEVPPGGHVLMDARGTDYVDPDILELIRTFTAKTGPARGIEVSLLGFRTRYQLRDQIQYVDYSTRELQAAVTPAQVLDILKAGHERFQAGQQLTRDFGRQVTATADAQHPLAVVVSCIDSRTPAEIIFDLGVGDIFSVRIAGNVTSHKVLGSVEYACAVAGAKLVVVMGHTRCGAVTAAATLFCSKREPVESTGCEHIEGIVAEIQKAIDPADCERLTERPADEQKQIVNRIARRNVARVVGTILRTSRTLADLERDGRIAVVGAMYDVVTGNIEFLPAEASPAPARRDLERTHS